jgi:hypothetical protein
MKRPRVTQSRGERSLALMGDEAAHEQLPMASIRLCAPLLQRKRARCRTSTWSEPERRRFGCSQSELNQPLRRGVRYPQPKRHQSICRRVSDPSAEHHLFKAGYRDTP